MKPSAAAVKRMNPKGWADFKHILHRLGVLASAVDDVPQEWQTVFKKAMQK